MSLRKIKSYQVCWWTSRQVSLWHSDWEFFRCITRTDMAVLFTFLRSSLMISIVAAWIYIFSPPTVNWDSFSTSSLVLNLSSVDRTQNEMRETTSKVSLSFHTHSDPCMFVPTALPHNETLKVFYGVCIPLLNCPLMPLACLLIRFLFTFLLF